MKITEPIIITRLGSAKYQATGRVEGCGPIRRLGRTEEEAKDRFFEACNAMGQPVRRGADYGRGIYGKSVRPAYAVMPKR